MKNLTVFSKDFEVTDAIQAYIEEKMSALYKYLNKGEEEVTFNFRLGKTTNHQSHGKVFFAEVSIHTPEKNYGGRIEADDMYVAIDLLKDELAGNITHHKEKARTLDRKSAQKFKDELHQIAAE
jgi:ribosomal subunit interface protein